VRRELVVRLRHGLCSSSRGRAHPASVAPR
jgi:hypothetical protein